MNSSLKETIKIIKKLRYEDIKNDGSLKFALEFAINNDNEDSFDEVKDCTSSSEEIKLILDDYMIEFMKDEIKFVMEYL